MDIESLRLFLDVWKIGNLTNAANNQYITQSSLSRRIAMLEKELGVCLFQRGKGKSQAVITPAGEAFSDIAERMLDLYEQAMELQKNEAMHFLTIACINSVQDYLLPGLIRRFGYMNPKLCITLENHHSVEIFPLLENRRVEVGITQSPSPYPDLQSDLLYEEDYRVIVQTPIAALTDNDTLHPGILAPEHEVFQSFSSEFLDWHKQWGQPLHAKIRVNLTSTAERYFSHPKDWMIVPAAVAIAMEKRGFISYGLEIQPPKHHVYIVYSKRNQTDYVKAFVDEAKSYFAKLT